MAALSGDKPHIVVLGDGEQALRRLGDWHAIEAAARLSVYSQTLQGPALLAALQEADVLVLVRDRIPLNAATIAQLEQVAGRTVDKALRRVAVGA